MALTESQLEYFREYRKAHRDKVNASFKRWHESHGRQRYLENLELTRAIKRKCYYKSTGNLEKAELEQQFIDKLRLEQPPKKAGAKVQFVGEEKLARRRAVVRKARYRHIVGIPTYMEPDKCEICGGSRKICMDHDHETHTFRGWICDDCNLALGRTKEDTRILSAMISYLEKHKKEAV